MASKHTFELLTGEQAALRLGMRFRQEFSLIRKLSGIEPCGKKKFNPQQQIPNSKG